MKTFTKIFTQKLPISIETAWNFFSSPLNLKKITPKEMNFVITSTFTEETKMYEGMLITYKVSPLLNIPLNWVTEITHIKHLEYFVDEQRFGPFALWHHEHHFEKIDNGVLMTDHLTYAIPFGFIGELANSLIVAKQTQHIFDYRKTAVENIFGIYS